MRWMLIGLGLMTACSAKSPATKQEPTQVLFEVRYVNYSKGFQWRGLVVDSTGAVYRYEATELGQSGLSKSGRADALLGLLRDRLQFSKQADPDEFAQHTAGLADALEEDMGERTHKCYDYGQVLFIGYLASGEPVILKEAGDHVQLNPKAHKTVAWLQSLDPAYQEIPCQ